MDQTVILANSNPTEQGLKIKYAKAVLKTSGCEAQLQVAGLVPARSLGLATAGRPGLLQVGKLRCHCRFWSTGFPAGVGSRCKRNRPGGW
jgi:hypothetical protein